MAKKKGSGPRGASVHNVAQRTSKVWRELQGAIKSEKEVEFKNDKKKVAKWLDENPGKMAAVKLVLKTEEAPAYDPKTHFNPSFATKTIAFIPSAFLADEIAHRLSERLISKVFRTLLAADKNWHQVHPACNRQPSSIQLRSF